MAEAPAALCLDVPPASEQSAGRTYVPPSWGAPPIHRVTLTVIKDGALQAPIELLARDHFILGKRPDVCDILSPHESISRVHAVLQFSAGGELYVADLGSTHGSRLNKTALVPHRYTLAPVGSVLSFGASSRLYVVEGPPCLAPPEPVESAAHAALRAASEARAVRKAAERTAAAAKAAVAAAGVMWGQAEDAVEEEEEGRGDGGLSGLAGDDDVSPAGVARRLSWIELLNLSALGDKELAAYDLVHRRLVRLRHLLAETERIRRKGSAGGGGGGGGSGGSGSGARSGRGGSRSGGEGGGRRGARARSGDAEEDEGGGGGGGGAGGLSAGQLAQLVRDEEAMDKLLLSVDEEEEALKLRLAAKGVPLPRGVAPCHSRGEARSGDASAYQPDAEDEVADTSSATWAGGGGGGGGGGARGVFLVRRAPVGAASAPPQAQARGAVQPPPRPPPRAVAERGASGFPSNQPATFSSASAALASLEEEVLQLQQDGAAAARAAAAAAAAAAGEEGACDELDSYMRATTAQLEAAEAQGRLQREEELRGERARLASLVERLRPSLGELAGGGGGSEVAAALTGDCALGGRSSEAVAAAPPARSAETALGKPGEAGVGDASFAVPAPSKRALEAGVSAPPMAAPLPKKPRVSAAGSVAGAAMSMLQPVAGAVPARSAIATEHAMTPATAAAAPQGELEAPEDVATWQPPTGQTGDGRTALNERFGGRY